MRSRLVAIFVAALAACTREQAQPAAPADAGARAPAGTAAGADVSYVTAATAMRPQPSETARGPAGGRSRAGGILAVLQRGEKVTVLETRDDWAHVRASDETEGWVKKGVLLPAQGVTEATLLAEADAFDRPDLLAFNARRKVEPGALVLVLRSRELFSEVNLSSGVGAWLLTDRLSTQPRHVMVAKLVEKARWLVRAGKPDEAKVILELARKDFADVPLVEVLARELGEAPDGGDGGPADGGSN